MIVSDLKKRIFTSLILLLLLLLIFNYNIILVYVLIVLGVLSVIEFLHLTNEIFKKKIFFVLLNLFFIFYIFTFCYGFLFFSGFIGLKMLLYIFLIGCIASDIGGFVFGKIFKGPKLTKISPKKTYAGAVGSVVLTLIVVSLLFDYYLQSFNYKIIIIGLMTTIFCQLGDLSFSFIKRKAKVKNSGNFLPGHGGILDRLDGIFLGIPMSFITLILLN